MRKAIMLAVAACALGATQLAAQPKKEIGYDNLVLLIAGGDWFSWCHYLAAFPLGRCV